MKKQTLCFVGRCIAFSFLALGNLEAASAAMLADQPPLDGGDGYLSSIDAGAQNAESFSLASQADLTSIEWWGFYAFGDGSPIPPDDLTNGIVTPLDNFYVRLLADAGGDPATGFDVVTGVLARDQTALVSVLDDVVFHYALEPSALLSLAGGTHYLSVMNDPTETASGDPLQFYWLLSGTGDGNQWFRAADGDAWAWAPDGDFSLRINGERVQSTPEPSTLALFAGMASWLPLRRALRRRSHAIRSFV